MLPALIGISGHEVGAEEEAAILRLQPAGFILFSRNVDSVEQVRSLTETLRKLCRHHPVIAVDQEGGRVVRTASLGLNLPSPASLARSGGFNGIVELGAVTAMALRYLGVNLNFAPVLDICHDPSAANALPGRCWGDNPQDVISRGGVYSSNLRRGGVQSCGKHFPGMGGAQADPHFSLPVVDLDERELFKTDLLPFLALCPELSSIMSAHIMLPQIDPDYPATLSERVIRGLLRDRLGFRGVVFTDDLCMGAIAARHAPDEAALLSLKAGCDLPLICHDPLSWLDGVASRLEGLDAYDRDDSFKRVEALSDSLCFPFPEKAGLWDSCLRRAEALCRLAEGEAGEELPSSPVQKY